MILKSRIFHPGPPQLTHYLKNDSVLVSAKAGDTNGAESSGAEPAAARVRPVFLMNRRLVIYEILLVFIFGSSSGWCHWIRQVQMKEVLPPLAVLSGR